MTAAHRTVLLHSFCTHFADADARHRGDPRAHRHADMRTTAIYTTVNPSRLEHDIAERGRQNCDARRAAAGA